MIYIRLLVILLVGVPLVVHVARVWDLCKSIGLGACGGGMEGPFFFSFLFFHYYYLLLYYFIFLLLMWEREGYVELLEDEFFPL